jgi:hypothetical protein
MMVRIRSIVLLFTVGAMLTACTQDQSKYDITSPCVASNESIFLDIPCEKRLPVENYEFFGKIAGS